MIQRLKLMTAIVALFVTSSTMAQVSVSTKLPATAVPGGSFTVELNVTKADISGFAKLQQLLPTGFTATVGETANATFSFKDRKVKFLWMALPNNDFTVSYKVNVDPALTGNQIIEGTFAYIHENETEKFIIPKDIITIQSDQSEAAKQAAMDNILAEQQAKEDAAAAAREEAAPEEPAAEEPAAEEEVAEEPAAEEPAAEEEVAEENPRVEVETTEVVETTETEVEEVVEEDAKEAAEEVVEEVAEAEAPAPEANYNDAMMKSKPGLVFRVQVAAGPNRVDPAFFQNKFGISDAVVIEEHDGMFKYMVGEFGSYRPAKTFSNELRDTNGVDGPFVTSYNDGNRIHVREALEIAGQ
ncbi:MAG: hypothetical protein QF371_06085 [Flavobacteriales bacterium]|nr:hypothetical protein [Flavobacteriales bacterium]